MHVEVLVFGQVAEIAAAPLLHVEVNPAGDVQHGARVDEVLRAMGEQHPSIAFALASARLAVNHAFATSDTRVHARDEVALIALVGGG